MMASQTLLNVRLAMVVVLRMVADNESYSKGIAARRIIAWTMAGIATLPVVRRPKRSDISAILGTGFAADICREIHSLSEIHK